MTVFASPVPTAEQIPFLWSLGIDPAPRMKVGSARWRQLTSAEKVLYAMSEAEWHQLVTAVAELFGWRVQHETDSRKSPSGQPDLILIRDRVVWAELKSETGRVSAAQEAFMADLRAARAEVYAWRPRHEALVLEVLR